MYVFIFIFIYVPAIICSHFKFRPSPTYWPTVCPPIYLCVYIGLSRLLELRKPEYDWGVGWGGMLTFMWTCGSSWCYAHAGWGGWGGMLTFMWTCGSSWCYAHAGWGGVGWGGMLTFMWTCGSSWCYAHAGWGGGGVGWDVNVHVKKQKKLVLHVSGDDDTDDDDADDDEHDPNETC